ncbi:MAG: hypothetical protein Q4A07_10080 [Coriobacteriales bacterium]|nr:hypothetical protein [Coriobacteriales bacterium]
MPNDQDKQTEGQQEGAAKETDYKALWEQAKAEAEKWKAQSRKNESRAKANYGAAKDLEEVNQQVADLSKRLEAAESENASLKAGAKRAAMVKEVSAETGVPEAIVSTLAATDKKALAEAATAIAEAYRPGGAPAANEAGSHVNTGGSAKTASQKFGDAMDKLLGN